MLADAPWTTWHKISWSPQDILPAGMNVLLANAECRNPPTEVFLPCQQQKTLQGPKPRKVSTINDLLVVTCWGYKTAPNDSGVGGFVGTIDLTSGIITPVAFGMKSPHGLLFVPQSRQTTPNDGNENHSNVQENNKDNGNANHSNVKENNKDEGSTN